MKVDDCSARGSSIQRLFCYVFRRDWQMRTYFGRHKIARDRGS